MDKFIDDSLKNYSSETQFVMEYMAINIEPIDYNDVILILSFKIKKDKAAILKSVINELRREEYPIIFSKGVFGLRQTFALEREFALLLIKELVLSGKYSGNRNSSSEQYVGYNNSVSEKFANLILNKPNIPFSTFEIGNADYSGAIRTALVLDSYEGIEKLLPSSYLCRFFQTTTYDLVCDLGDVKIIDYWYNRLTLHFVNDFISKQTISMTYGIIKILLKGEIDKIPEYVTLLSDDGCYLNGMYNMYKGDYDLAASSFERGIKLAKKYNDDILPEFPLFIYGYVLSLILSSTPKLIKRRSALLAKKPIHRPLYLPVYIALSKKEYGNVPVIYSHSCREYLNYNVLNGFLYLTVLKHFNSVLLKEETELLNNISKIDEDRYKLLALEIFSHFPDYQQQYDSLVQELGVTALLARDVVLSDWEREIDKLLSKESEVNVSNTKLSKICYVVDTEYSNIQPISKTSSNGGKTWTKGRNIALKTFVEGAIDSMTELDKQISKCVTIRKGWYEAIGYEIDVQKAVEFLVGNPNVYLSSNMDLAMEVTAIKPEITINVTKKGYNISSNITNLDKPCRFIRESATRLNVLNLSPEECNVLKVLSNIKNLPFEAKDKLILLLKRLNRTMVVHSDLIDEGTVIRKIKSDSRTVVQLYPLGENLQAEFYVKPFTSTSPYCRVGIGAKSVMGVIEGEEVQALRDLNEEREMLNKLISLLEPFSEIVENRCLYDSAESALQLIDVLRDCSDIALVEWPEGVKYKIMAHVNSDALKLSLKSQNNWFEMEGELQIDESKIITVKSLIEMIRSSDGRFVKIGENEFIALSDKLRKQLTEIETVTTLTKNGARVNKFALPILSRPLKTQK